jgi:uncharacterized membrane protein YkoI
MARSIGLILRKPLAVTAIAIGLVGGSYGVASAVTSSSASPSPASSAAATKAPTDATKGQQRTDETALTGDTLAKVKAAALAKVGSGATLIRAETEGDGTAAYEAHVRKSDGTEVTVLFDKSFTVVSVETGGKGCRGGGQRTDETALTGDTLAKVKAAAIAKVGSGATIERVETDADGHAAYEVHLKTSGGTEETVYVDKSFNVVSVGAR